MTKEPSGVELTLNEAPSLSVKYVKSYEGGSLKRRRKSAGYANTGTRMRERTEGGKVAKRFFREFS